MQETIPALLTDPNTLSIIVFLLVAVAVIWRDRENIERYSIVFVRRTQKGIDILDRVASLGPRLWRMWSTVGVWAGFGIAALMFVVVLYFTLKLFLVPDTTVAVAPVLPTASSFTDPMEAGYMGIPFWYFMIGITAVLVVHEMMHGVIARVEDFEVEYVGLILLAIIPGAFVQPAGQRDFFEPDEGEEEEEERHSPWDQGNWFSQLRVLGAGPWSNITLAIILFGALFAGGIAVDGMDFDMPDGLEVTQVVNDSPAEQAGLEEGMHIVNIDGNDTYSYQAYSTAIEDFQEGENVTVATADDETFTVTLGQHPQLATGQQEPPNRSQVEYQPAPIDYLLVPMEERRPGTIDWYDTQIDRLEQFEERIGMVADQTQYRELGRWVWIQDNYDALDDRADQRIQELEMTLQEEYEQNQVEDGEATSQGYMGIAIETPAILQALLVLGMLLFIIAFLNIAIGPVNLLPIKGLDGGWMVSILMNHYAPHREKLVSRAFTGVTLALLLINFAFLIVRFVL